MREYENIPHTHSCRMGSRFRAHHRFLTDFDEAQIQGKRESKGQQEEGEAGHQAQTQSR